MSTSIASSAHIALLTLAALIGSVTAAAAETHPAVGPGATLSETETVETYSTGIAQATPLLLTAASASAIVVGVSTENELLAYAGVVGVLVGPSMGHVYTQDWRGALIGTGLRVAGTGLVVAGAAAALGSTYAHEEDDTSGDGGAAVLMLGGALTFVGGTIYSIVDAPHSAERANKRQGNLSLSPAPIQGPDRSTGWGAMIQATF
jgi:hypothetical protein